MDVKISSGSGKEITANVALHTLTQEEKRRNSVKALGLLWGLSLASLPLPPIHWVTVPGFFLFGIYWSVRKLREQEHFVASRFPCPECGQEVALPPQVARNPLVFVCPSCRYGLKLTY